MDNNNVKSPTIQLIELKYQKYISEVIKDLFKEYNSPGLVAKHMGISRQYLHTICKKLGLQGNSSKTGGRPGWREANKKAWDRHQAAQ